MKQTELEKIQMYFEAALAVPEENRQTFLAGLRSKTPHLYIEVIALLKADTQSKIWDGEDFFETDLNRSNVFHVGDEIGSYSIIEQIGEGGMGVIYKAHDKKLQRDVALKFLPVNMNSNASTRQRFLAEARAASRLDHPHICVIHDVSETADGQLYITMPCYDGETLSNRISRGAIQAVEAIEICIQVALGLCCAHMNNIVHRDVKPSNIMLTENNGVKVLDFGIAQVENSHLTQTGVSIGTLAYMSPEQLRGEHVDARTDVWALGVVLFEMLTGQQAFPAKALPDILQSVLNETDSTLESVSDTFPEVICLVLKNAMMRDIEQRYENMENMLESLYETRATLLASTQATKTFNTVAHSKKKPSYHWDEQILDKIAALLLPTLGPIASRLVTRNAKTAADLNELALKLAETLPEKNSRDKFIKQMESQVIAFTTPPVPRTIKTDGSLAGVDISTLQLAEIEQALIDHLGPITLTLIKRHIVNASSVTQLFDTLAQHLDKDSDKQVFIDRMLAVFEMDR